MFKDQFFQNAIRFSQFKFQLVSNAKKPIKVWPCPMDLNNLTRKPLHYKQHLRRKIEPAPSLKSPF